MTVAKISLDTNVLIFGLRKIDPYAELLLQNLFLFDVRICEQVERELWNNFADWELKLFYEQAELLPYFSIVYQMSSEILLKKYQMIEINSTRQTTILKEREKSVGFIYLLNICAQAALTE